MCYTLSGKIMTEQTVSARFPDDMLKALDKAIKKGKGLNKSDYIRDATRKKLREDGLL